MLRQVELIKPYWFIVPPDMIMHTNGDTWPIESYNLLIQIDKRPGPRTVLSNGMLFLEFKFEDDWDYVNGETTCFGIVDPKGKIVPKPPRDGFKDFTKSPTLMWCACLKRITRDEWLQARGDPSYSTGHRKGHNYCTCEGKVKQVWMINTPINICEDCGLEK